LGAQQCTDAAYTLGAQQCTNAANALAGSQQQCTDAAFALGEQQRTDAAVSLVVGDRIPRYRELVGQASETGLNAWPN
jgi:hypothetical protein